MKVDYSPHISLAETGIIIQSVRKLFNYDLGVFSPASLQLLISTYINAKGIKLADVLLSRLTDYPDVFKDLLYWLDIPDTEMFRNPDVWKVLQKKIVPKLIRERTIPKIWFPSCSSGEEIFSMVILALEDGYRDKIEIFASTASVHRLNEAKRGMYRGNSLDICRENYTRSGGKIELEHYIEKIDSSIARKKYIRANIDFKEQNLIPEKRSVPIDLVIFKNRLIYFSQEARYTVLNNLIASIRKGGYLLLGYKEMIRDEKILSRLKLVYKEEKIYQVI